MMIADAAIMADIRKQWGVARNFANMESQRQYLIPGAGVVSEGPPPDAFYNLPFILAYGVLQQTLRALADQGMFHARPKATLEELMKASKPSLPWQDYGEVDKGKTDRNAVAHDGVLFPKARCRDAVDAVEAELRAWGIVVP